jgi:c-di-GMP-binding flagellar brake protein YcgR
VTDAPRSNSDRRAFKRVRAPVFVRPSAVRLFDVPRQTVDISLGGMRIYADRSVLPGQRLELELFLPDGGSLPCTVEVMWVEDMPSGAPARYDVGLKFVTLEEAHKQKLGVVLDGADEL